MEDLASYLRGMDPAQRQSLMAEQVRGKQNSDYTARLGEAMKGDPKMKMLLMATMLAGNKRGQAATDFAYRSDMSERAPKQLGNTGFFNPDAGEYVASPMYTDENDARREATRWQKELQRETFLDTTRARTEQAREAAELRAATAREAETGRNARAAEALQTRAMIAALTGNSRSDVTSARQERDDEAALRAAEQRAQKAYEAAMSDRGNKPLAGPLGKSLRSSVEQADVLGRVLRDSKPAYFSSGVASAGPIQDAKMALARTMGDAAPKNMQDMNKFWGDFRRGVEMLKRHENFGATLTNNEQTFWNQVSVGPGMSHDQGMDLLRRLKLDTERVVQKSAETARGNRVYPEAIEAATGGRFPADPKPQRPNAAEYLPPDRRRRLEDRGAVETNPQGSIGPNRRPGPAPVTTSDGWKIEQVD